MKRTEWVKCLRVGQSGIDTAGKAADAVSENLVRAVHNHGDGGQDKRVFRHRLRAVRTDEPLAHLHEHLCKQIHLSLLLYPFFFPGVARIYSRLERRSANQTRFEMCYSLHRSL